MVGKIMGEKIEEGGRIMVGKIMGEKIEEGGKIMVGKIMGERRLKREVKSWRVKSWGRQG